MDRLPQTDDGDQRRTERHQVHKDRGAFCPHAGEAAHPAVGCQQRGGEPGEEHQSPPFCRHRHRVGTESERHQQQYRQQDLHIEVEPGAKWQVPAADQEAVKGVAGGAQQHHAIPRVDAVVEQGQWFALAKQPEHPEQGDTHAEQCLFAGTLAEEERPLQQGEQRNEGADHPHIGSRGAVGGVIGQTLVEHHTERRQHQQLAEPGANLTASPP